MREVDGRRMPRRVLGRWRLEMRARALLIAVHRFGRCRAATAADQAWAARWLDGLTALLEAQPGAEMKFPAPAAKTAPRYARSSAARFSPD